MTHPTPQSSIFGTLTALPRGRHRLTREQVAESQRTRLMAAAAELLAEGGSANTTITEIARRANVSPNHFYEYFSDKEECVLAAYDVFVETLITRINADVASTTDWHDFLVGAIDAYLGSLEADRAVARAFLIEMDAVGPAARRRRREGLASIAALLKQQHAQIRRRDETLGPLPDRVYLGLVNAVRALACDALESDPPFPLTDLQPDILHWITATIRGAAAATQDLASEAPSVASGS